MADKTMVERVRTAIAHELDREGEPFYRLDAAARAAVAEMREPTPVMIETTMGLYEGQTESPLVEMIRGQRLRQYQEMIDAALSHQPPQG